MNNPRKGGLKMAVKYLNEAHKETSGYKVSGKEALKIRKELIEKTPSDRKKNIRKLSSLFRKVNKPTVA